MHDDALFLLAWKQSSTRKLTLSGNGFVTMSVPDKPRPGELVVLTSVPPGLLDGLPQEDQNAIVAIVGKPVLLVEYEEDGRAELHFDDPVDGRAGDYSQTHSIWVAPQFIERHRS